MNFRVKKLSCFGFIWEIDNLLTTQIFYLFQVKLFVLCIQRVNCDRKRNLYQVFNENYLFNGTQNPKSGFNIFTAEILYMDHRIMLKFFVFFTV